VLKNLPNSYDDCLEIWEPQTPGNLRSCQGHCFTHVLRVGSFILKMEATEGIETKLHDVIPPFYCAICLKFAVEITCNFDSGFINDILEVTYQQFKEIYSKFRNRAGHKGLSGEHRCNSTLPLTSALHGGRVKNASP
jgi:hypothetical protein